MNRIKRWVRRKFGKWVLSIDPSTGEMALVNLWKGVIYVEKVSWMCLGDKIVVPRRTMVISSDCISGGEE